MDLEEIKLLEHQSFLYIESDISVEIEDNQSYGVDKTAAEFLRFVRKRQNKHWNWKQLIV